MASAPLTPEPYEPPLIGLDDLPPDDDQEAVAAEIRALMGRYRVSQQRLAAATGLSSRGMSERLAGKTNFTIRELGRVARFFGKSLGSLVARAERTEDGFLDVTRNEHPPTTFTAQLSLFGEDSGSTAGDVVDTGPAFTHKEAA